MDFFLWRGIADWEEGELQKPKYRVPAAAADWILGYAKKTIPRLASDKIAEIVIACLEGHWNGARVSDASGDITKVLTAFSDAVQ